MPNILYLNQFKTTTLSVVGGIDNSQTTGIVIQSVSGIDTTKPGIACLTYTDPINTSNAEWIEYTAINSTTKTFTGVTRGSEGYSAKSHDNGVTVAFPLSESHINRLSDAVSIGGDATNPITGVLDEDTMSSDSAVKVPTQQSVKAYVDAGWCTLGETMTYASADDPTYTATVAGVDLTGVLSPGMRMRVEQSTGGTKYFIITKVAFSTDTTITLYGGTDYDLANEAISNPKFAVVKAPVGFPLEPDKWTHKLISTSSSSLNVGGYGQAGDLTISVPIGFWNIRGFVSASATRNTTNVEITFATSEATGSVSSGYEKTIATFGINTGAGTNQIINANYTPDFYKEYTSKTTIYVITTGTYTSGSLYRSRSNQHTLEAVCAYL